MKTQGAAQYIALVVLATLSGCGDEDTATLVESGDGGRLPVPASTTGGGSAGASGSAHANGGLSDEGGGASAAGNEGDAGSTANPIGEACGAHYCGAGEVCLRERCFDGCGVPESLANLEASLGQGVEPLGQICRSEGVIDTAYDANFGQVSAIEVTVKNDTSSSRLTVHRWLVESATAHPIPQPVGQHTVFSTEWVYPTAFAVAASGDSPVLIGYTTGEEGYPGKVLIVGAEAASSLVSNSNHDLVAVDEDEWLLTTTEADGAKLYWVTLRDSQLSARLVASGMGLFAGSVALVSQDGLWAFVGAYGAVGHRLYAVPIEVLRSAGLATAPVVDMATALEVVRAEAPSNFATLADGRLLLRSQAEGSAELAVDVATVQVDATGLVLTNTRRIASSAALRGAFAAANTVLLQWDGAMSVVSSGE